LPQLIACTGEPFSRHRSSSISKCKRSILPELIGEKSAGRKQTQHEFLYWEFNGWTAIRQGNWRAVKPAKSTHWSLYDLASDPSESKDVVASNPAVLESLVAMSRKAHEPVVEGTFARTDRHERDRRAKMGKEDEYPGSDGSRKKVEK
jgi:arylsulfatase A-like enzyme